MPEKRAISGKSIYEFLLPILTMSHPLDSCWIKINRASEHIQCLDLMITAFLDDCYGVTKNHNPDSGRVEYKVRNSADPKATARFAVIAGEAIHHLRSSLDHLAWQLVKVNGHPDPSRVKPKVEFPVFVDRKEYMTTGRRKIHAAGESASALVERLQPYNRRNHPKLDALWIIHYFDIVDKHRILPVVVTMADMEMPAGYKWSIQLNPPGAPIGSNPAQSGSIGPVFKLSILDPKDGANIFSSPDANMNMDIKFRFKVVLGNVGVLREHSMVAVLQHLRDYTVYVIKQFTVFF